MSVRVIRCIVRNYMGGVKASGHGTLRPVRAKAPAGTNGNINRKALSAMPYSPYG
ncbi:hypothetical protein AGMMS49940_02360 [Spirochaetia bacterium]|nr:hypothetical protein AGMMS49940_02360 [Spirochaetia bacterium]